MPNAAREIFRASALCLLILLVNGSLAMAATCKTSIDDTDRAISHAMKLASAIAHGVTSLATGGSGDHPKPPLISALKQFQNTTSAFVKANKSDVMKPDESNFDSTSSDCPEIPAGSLGKDGCDYCPKYSTRPGGYCPDDYYQVLNADVYVLAFGSGTGRSREPLLAGRPGMEIVSTESMECIESDLDNPKAHVTDKSKKARALLSAIYAVLGATDGPNTGPNRSLLGIP